MEHLASQWAVFFTMQNIADDDYYQTDSVKVCPYSLKLECIDCHKKEHSSDLAKE